MRYNHVYACVRPNYLCRSETNNCARILEGHILIIEIDGFDFDVNISIKQVFWAYNSPIVFVFFLGASSFLNNNRRPLHIQCVFGFACVAIPSSPFAFCRHAIIQYFNVIFDVCAGVFYKSTSLQIACISQTSSSIVTIKLYRENDCLRRRIRYYVDIIVLVTAIPQRLTTQTYFFFFYIHLSRIFYF